VDLPQDPALLTPHEKIPLFLGMNILENKIISPISNFTES
jgi:hypothetical protein